MSEELAVFPIPNCVTFPYSVTPLHVFEPRYRAMVEHCIETKQSLAICHVDKTLREGPSDQNMTEALNSNQATYVPAPVVSAGYCELVKTLDDGRMMINVYSKKRYRLGKQIQSLPFYIYEAEEFPDEALTPTDFAAAEQLKDKLLHRLLALTADREEVQALLKGPAWQHKPVEQFSFEIFSILHTDPEMMQEILEIDSAPARMDAALKLLSSVPAQL